MTPEAKGLLARTIRGSRQNPGAGLRERLLGSVADAARGSYRLDLPLAQARLGASARRRRELLEAWLDEQARASGASGREERDAARRRALEDAVKLSAATFLHRIVLLRQMEAFGRLSPPVVTGVWCSQGYQEFREFAPGLCGDATGGFDALLALVFDELALELPGLFGEVGVTRLLPVPPEVVREVLERLDVPELESAWTDDTTLGWVYQFWNDPDREALDDKLARKEKLEPHEIASKTQMFTERYMVEWLLQNSLGPLWLAVCRRNGWAPDAEPLLAVLESRRAEWRARRETGEVPPDALLPARSDVEARWQWYVPQPVPDDAVASAPETLRAVRILDPACGSGHFLVIAFDLLAALHREEARHRGEPITDREIAERILDDNLFGVDIDPRAVQLAAAALYLKAKVFAPDARPQRVNVVAPVLRLGNLAEDDPALLRLVRELRAEAGIPETLTRRIVKSLAGVDHLGTLLRVDAAVEEALRAEERVQLSLGAPGAGDEQGAADAEALRSTVLAKVEAFLAHHAGTEDLGVRLDGEQLAAGVRFIRIVKEGTYDLVVGNPPYQGTSKLKGAGYVTKHYPRGKADLYAAFWERGLELTRPGGTCALVTMQGWMFLGQYDALRTWMVTGNTLRVLADLRWCAFEHMRHATIAMAVVARGPGSGASVALAPTPREERVESDEALDRKRAALLAHVGRYEFKPSDFEVIDGQPLVYWWSREELEDYRRADKLAAHSPARFGLNSGNNLRFIRWWWEVDRRHSRAERCSPGLQQPDIRETLRWERCLRGAVGLCWIDRGDSVIRWDARGLHAKVYAELLYGSYTRQIRNESSYFRAGIAFTKIGASFLARAHRYRSVIESAAPSVYPGNVPNAVCFMNSARARFVLESLNPTINFQVGDVNRLPIFPVDHAQDIWGVLDAAFTAHESAREASVEFKHPGPSPWRYAQTWAQRAVDRATGEPLPAYQPDEDPPRPIEFVSHAVGLALGRFGANNEGVVDEAPGTALPGGVLFVSAATGRDSLDHPACAPLHAAWQGHGAAVGEGDDLRTWLRKSFFSHHREAYENRPIYLPLSSEKKSFVAWVGIHRWTRTTLQDLLADHLEPEQRTLVGLLADLQSARDRRERGASAARVAKLQGYKAELDAFIALVRECAERGPPRASEAEPRRERDARHELHLDDGVMVNAAVLWPLLAPQWSAPKRWWAELASAAEGKHYDWSRAAGRYFPARVEEKCARDPSLAVAHGCFWRLHPAKAYEWELRLNDEIRPGFTIDEPGSDTLRAGFLAAHPEEARAIEHKGEQRLERRRNKAAQGRLGLVEDDGDEDPEPESEAADEAAEG